MPDAPPYRVRFLRVTEIPTQSDRRAGAEGLSDAILREVRADGLIVLRNVPRDAAVLLDIAKGLGRPQPATSRASSATPADIAYWIGNLDAHETERWWGGLLPLHTAGANEPAEPRLHMMLMMDAGARRPDADGNTGQSLISRVDDAIDDLVRNHPEKAEEYVAALLHTPVTTDFVPHLPPRSEPFLRRSPDGTWAFRYWIDMQRYARRDGWRGDRFDALEAFDAALNAARIEISLRPGDMVVVDNHRVAHGRMPFPREQIDGGGQRGPSTRRVYNVHVEADI